MNLKRLIVLLLLTILTMNYHDGSAQQFSISYCDEMPLTQGNANDTLTLPKFDTNLGTLMNITFFIELSGSIEEYIENFELVGTGDVLCSHSIDIETFAPTGDLLDFNILKENTFNLGPFDGIVDFSGTSGETRKDILLNEIKTWNLSYDNIYLKNNEQNIIKIPFNASSHHELDYQGDCRVRFITYSNIKICVFYHYRNITGSLGDYVWLDENGDGMQDTAEPPLAGIMIELIDNATGQSIARDTTDINGNYLFNELNQGDYLISVVASSLPDHHLLTTGNLPYIYHLQQGEHHLQADFGYRYDPPRGSIGDYTWLDENGDGLQNPSEAPLPGIILYLYEGDTENAIDAATSDENGNYIFSQLLPGTYRIIAENSINHPDLFLTTNNSPFNVILEPGQQFRDADFGFKRNEIPPPPPVIASFTADPTEGVSPLEVTFTNTSENATQAWWDFGDGTNSEEWSPVHIYTNPPLKYYDVTLIVWNDYGDYDTLTCPNLINIYRAAYCNFEAIKIAGRPGDGIQFINRCSGLVNFFTWDYGDGTRETLRSDVRYAINPIHTYSDTGSFDVTLTASGQGGSDTLTWTDFIYIDGDYCELKLVDSSQTEPGMGWSNVIDHDVLSDHSSMRAPNSLDVLATFMFADSTAKNLHTVRFKCNDAHRRQSNTNLARRFEVLVSEDGARYRRCSAGYLSENDAWETYSFEPVAAKYIRLNFRSARKRKSPYITLCEFQVCAESNPAVRRNFESLSVSGEDAAISKADEHFTVFPNFPNPFNPSTVIGFNLPDAGTVNLHIYDIRGRSIYSLSEQVSDKGFHAVKWHGCDHHGQTVQSGIYIYRITFNAADGITYSDAGRMILIK